MRTLALTAIVLTACGASSQDVASARTTFYDGQFDTVFAVMRDRVARDYRVDADPVAARLSTPWVQVDKVLEVLSGEPHPKLQQAHKVATRHFVRFEVELLGGPPWVVQVRGFASTWKEHEGRPFIYPESERPPFLETRETELVLAIHNVLTRCCRRRQ